ncbi:MAG: dCTP deaminase [Verrucomicrobia bacterium]|nr:dCTP deaminase [Verrucomicrobiota bacterium]
MVLANTEILAAIERGEFNIEGLAGRDPGQSPFKSMSVDLHLDTEILVPQTGAFNIDLSTKAPIARVLAQNCDRHICSENNPWMLKNGQFILAQTKEVVDFLFRKGQTQHYCARVEGKSSLARCGVIVHLTAPTIHQGFKGPIALEICNLGPFKVTLTPGMPICQLIVETVMGQPADAPNQFSGQRSPSGVKNGQGLPN